MSNSEIAHLETEIVRLQTENAWDEHHINGLHSLVGSLVEEIYHYKSHASMDQKRADELQEERDRLFDMNVNLTERLVKAGLLFEVGGPMDDLRLAKAQLATLSSHIDDLQKKKEAEAVLT